MFEKSLIEANRKPGSSYPYFTIMMVNDAVEVNGNELSILDIAEIIALRLE